MNTPTPTPRTDAAWSATFDGEQMSAGRTARALRECSQQLETELAAERAEVEQLKGLASWAHTCIHHNDEQRTRAERCPVCATAERDQLRADCENETKWAAHYLAQSIADKARAERAEAALADPQQLHAHCLRTLNEGQIAHLFGGRMTEIVNRAEAELATERARLDHFLRWDPTFNSREDIYRDMQEAAK